MFKEKTVFTSSISFQDAQMKARMAGYAVIGQSMKSGQYVVFARPTNAFRSVW